MDEVNPPEQVIHDAAEATCTAIKPILEGDTAGIWNKFLSKFQGEITSFGKIIILSIIVLAIAYLISKMIKKLITRLAGKYSLDPSLRDIINRVDTMLIFAFAALIILDLFGINTASVLTVLGAAGLAVGLALKDTLSNIAAGIFLLTQHPYATGHSVECAGKSGKIMKIGLFTTHLRTPQGQDIFIPNNSIIGAPITNYSSNDVRRADISVGIGYEDNIEEGIRALQKLLNSNNQILKDPEPAIVVSGLKDSCIELTLRFWAKNEDYWDAYFAVNRALKDTIEGAGLNIPFPQCVVTMAKTNEK